ncbi:MAG: amidohydrolase family protein, partial [Anaerolineae bacterium]
MKDVKLYWAEGQAMPVDLVIHNAHQLLTVASPGGAKRGAAIGELGIIENGAVAVKEGRIALIGATKEVMSQVMAGREIDARGKVVAPGFVDPHTHLVFASSREDEFEQRIKGATYMEIMAAGGGIMSTVRATRAATLEELMAQSRPRLDHMLAYGTTTAEAKTGYGLNVVDELKMLQAIRELDD